MSSDPLEHRHFLPVVALRPLGFSLIEVTLAIAIIATAVVTVVGLLPAGMSQFQQASESSVATQIFEKVLADARQTDFSQLVYHGQPQPDQPAMGVFRAPSAASPELRYFDNDGQEVVPSRTAARQNPDALSGSEKARILYHVLTRITTNAYVPADASGYVGNYLATVTVQVAANPSNRALGIGLDQLFMPAPGLRIRTFSADLAKND